MVQSNEVVGTNDNNVRRNGWTRHGYILNVKPSTETGSFVVLGIDLLRRANLISLYGWHVDDVAARQQWTPSEIEDDPSLMAGLFKMDERSLRSGNLIVPEGVSVAMHSDDRQSALIFKGELPILEVAGVQLAA